MDQQYWEDVTAARRRAEERDEVRKADRRTALLKEHGGKCWAGNTIIKYGDPKDPTPDVGEGVQLRDDILGYYCIY